MLKVLAEEAAVCVDGKWQILRAVLVNTLGGHKVIYFDKNGIEVHSEMASRSQFKDVIKKMKNEKGDL